MVFCYPCFSDADRDALRLNSTPTITEAVYNFGHIELRLASYCLYNAYNAEPARIGKKLRHGLALEFCLPSDSLSILSWPLTHRDAPASVFGVLGLTASTTTPGNTKIFDRFFSPKTIASPKPKVLP